MSLAQKLLCVVLNLQLNPMFDMWSSASDVHTEPWQSPIKEVNSQVFQALGQASLPEGETPRSVGEAVLELQLRSSENEAPVTGFVHALDSSFHSFPVLHIVFWRDGPFRT